MKNLIPIIGKSPSELPLDEFLVRLSKERTRAREAIITFLKSPVKPASKKRGLTKTALQKEMKEAGVSIDELRKMIEEAKDAGGQGI